MLMKAVALLLGATLVISCTGSRDADGPAMSVRCEKVVVEEGRVTASTMDAYVTFLSEEDQQVDVIVELVDDEGTVVSSATGTSGPLVAGQEKVVRIGFGPTNSSGGVPTGGWPDDPDCTVAPR